MAAKRRGWYYEHYNAKGNLVNVKSNDYDGKITGKIIFNVPAYFDENPEEARRLGYIKHITHSVKEIREMFPDIDQCTQCVVRSVRAIDEYTVEDVYHVIDKSEEMMLHAELGNIGDVYIGDSLFDDDEDDETEAFIWS